MPVSQEPITHSPGVGTVLISLMDFQPRLSDEPSSFTVEMRFSCNLAARESFILHLPGFYRCHQVNDCVSSFAPQGDDASLFPTATWDGASSPPRLIFTSSVFVSRGRIVLLLVPSSSGVRIPLAGLSLNQRNIQISLNSSSCLVPPTSLLSVSPVGSFARSEVLIFGTPIAGVFSSLTFEFTPSQPIPSGSKVNLWLSGFSRNLSTPIKTFALVNKSSSNYSFSPTATWDAKSNVLSFSTISEIKIASLMTLLIPASEKLQIPRTGTHKYDDCRCLSTKECNCSTILFWVDSVLSPISPRPVERLSLIGAIFESKITYSFMPSSSFQNVSVNLSVSLTFNFPLTPSDQLRLFLPGFRKSNSSSPAGNFAYLNQDTVPREIFDSGTWYPTSQYLLFKVLQSVGSEQAINLHFSPDFGFFFPLDGITGRTSDRFRVAVNGVYGNVLSTPVAAVQRFGSFLGSSQLHFAPRIAGASVNVSISFSASMLINVDERILISLPFFGGVKGDYAVFTSPPGLTDSAHWTPDNQTLVIRIRRVVPPYTPVALTVQGSSVLSGINLPLQGMAYDKLYVYTISTDCADGPVLLPLPFAQIDSVAALLNSSVVFGADAKAGQVVNLSLAFAVNRPLAVGDFFTVQLNGFQLQCSSCNHSEWTLHAGILVNGVSDDSIVAVWNSNTDVLIFKVVRGTLSALASIQVNILSTTELHVVLPQDGVTLGDNKIRIKVTGVHGNSDFVSITNVQPVGAFISSPKIDFVPPVANAVTELRISFSLSSALRPGDTILLAIPGFSLNASSSSGASAVDVTGFLLGAIKSYISAQWVLGESALRITVVDLIPAKSLVNITLSRDAGLTIPSDGVSQVTISMSVDAVDGKILPVATAYEPVGYISGNMELFFRPPVAASPVDIIFKFWPVSGLQANDECKLLLPLFTRASALPSSLQLDNISSSFGASWSVDSKTGVPAVTLKVRDAVSEMVEIMILAANEIISPTEGISQFSVFTFSCKSPLGNIQPTRIQTVQFFGKFLKSSLSYFPPRPGATISDLTIAFTYSQLLKTSETVVLHLPGFTWNPNFADLTRDVLTANSVQLMIEWRSASSNLVLTLQADVPSKADVNLTVSGWGLVLPALGVRDNVTLTVATNATAGPVLPSKILSVLAVGAFSDTFVTFSQAVANTVVDVRLTVVPLMRIARNDNMTVVLQGFEAVARPATANPSVVFSTRVTDGFVTKLSYTFPEAVQELRSTTIVLPQLRTPLAGLVKGYRGISFSLDSQSGAVKDFFVEKIQPFGSFSSALLRFLANPNDDSVLDIQFAFSATMEILTGEAVAVGLTNYSGSSATYQVQDDSGAFTSTAWNGDSQKFMLVPSKNIPAWKVVNLFIKNVRQVRNVASITATISTEASNGPVLPTAVDVVNTIGKISNSSLRFGNAVAGQVSSVVISFSLSASFQQGENILVGLPGFSIPSAAPTTTIQLTSSQWSYGIWSSSQDTLALFTKTSIPSNSLISITVPVTAGLKLPQEGVNASNFYYIRSNASFGQTGPYRFDSVQAVGSFSLVSLTFPSPLQVFAGQAATMLVEFVPTMNVNPAEKVSVALPGFTGTPVIQPSGEIASVTFLSSVMNVIFSSVRAAGVQVSLTITGLILPANGIQSGQQDITISSNAAAGPVLPTAFSSLYSVGALKQAKLSFDNPVANQLTALKFEITTSMSMNVSSNVSIYLPSFQVNNTLIERLSCPSPCSWNSEAKIFSVRPAYFVPANTLYTILLPQSTGFSLPVNGIRKDASGVKIGVESVFGRIQPTPVTSSQGVGVFLASSLRFDPGSAGVSNTIQLTFMYSFNITVGDTVDLVLKDFSRTSLQTVTVSGSSFGVLKWSQVAYTLTLTCTQEVPAFTEYSVQISPTFGLVTPAMALPRDSSTFLISSTAAQGPAQPRRIAASAPIGYFGSSTSLAFIPGVASQVNDVTLAFTSQLSLDEQDIVRLFLPAFQQAEAYRDVEMVTDGFNATAHTCFSSICPSSPGLYVDVQLRKKVLANVANLFTLSLGIVLPDNGVRGNDNGFKFSVISYVSPVPATSFALVSPVGAISSASLSFSPLEVKTSISIILQLSLAMNLNVEDTIVVKLPKFEGASFTNGAVTSSPSGCVTQSSWNAVDFTLTMKLASALAANAQLTVTVPPSLSISIPSQGVAKDDKNFTVSVDSNNGLVFPRPFSAVSRVVAFTSSSRLTLFSTLPLNSSAMMLQTVALQQIMSGDAFFLHLPGFISYVKNVPLEASPPVALEGFWNPGPSSDSCLACSQATLCLSEGLIVWFRESYEGELKIRVPAGVVMLPETGVTKNVTEMMVGTLASADLTTFAPTSSIAVSYSSFVPPLISAEELVIQEVSATRSSNLSLSLYFNSDLPAGTTMRLRLPFMQGDEDWARSYQCRLQYSDMRNHCAWEERKYLFDRRYQQAFEDYSFLVVEENSSDTLTFLSYTWTAASQYIEIKTSETIRGFQTLSFHIPTSAGLFVMPSGNYRPEDAASVEFDLPQLAKTSKQFLIADVTTIEPLFKETSILIKPGVQIQFSFVAPYGLHMTDVVRLYLPGFLLPSPPVSLSVSVSPAASMTWNVNQESASISLLVSSGSIPSMSKIQITIVATAGMQIPSSGVDKESGIMMELERAGRDHLRQDFDLVYPVQAFLSSSLSFDPTTVGRSPSIMIDFALPFNLNQSDTVHIIVPNLYSGASKTLTGLTTTEVCYPRLLPSLSVSSSSHESCKQGQDGCRIPESCAQGWYGPTCSYFCDDMLTCNALEKKGFCNEFGTCTCLPPFQGTFCNDTLSTAASCSSQQTTGVTQPAVSTTGLWSKEESAFVLKFSSQVPSWKTVKVTIPSITDFVLPVISDAIAAAFSISVHSQGKVTSSAIASVQRAYSFGCYTTFVTLNSSSYCSGYVPVRLCSKSQADAQSYTDTMVRSSLLQLTDQSCPQSCKDGYSPTKEECCSVAGAWNSAQCLQDSDCSGLPTDSTTAVNGIAKVENVCCSHCDSLEQATCNSSATAQACAHCSPSAPCYGYTIAKKRVSISQVEGGAVKLDNGAGMQVPPGVWPVPTEPAVVAIYSEPVVMPPGSQSVSQALQFEPSPLTFPEPGVTMNFPVQIDQSLLNSGMQLAAFKIVNGLLEPHRYPPKLVNGTVSVKTLSFSAYTVILIPTEQSTLFQSSTSSPSTTPAVTVLTTAAPAPPVPTTGAAKFWTAGTILAVSAGGGAVLSILAFVYAYWRISTSSKLVDPLLDKDAAELQITTKFVHQNGTDAAVEEAHMSGREIEHLFLNYDEEEPKNDQPDLLVREEMEGLQRLPPAVRTEPEEVASSLVWSKSSSSRMDPVTSADLVTLQFLPIYPNPDADADASLTLDPSLTDRFAMAEPTDFTELEPESSSNKVEAASRGGAREYFLPPATVEEGEEGGEEVEEHVKSIKDALPHVDGADGEFDELEPSTE